MNSPVSLEDVRQARKTIAPLALRTPMLPALSLGRLAGCELLLEAENLQRAGSFNVRGAANRIAPLNPAQKARGVITASAGNHAQGVAWRPVFSVYRVPSSRPWEPLLQRRSRPAATGRQCFSKAMTLTKLRELPGA